MRFAVVGLGGIGGFVGGMLCKSGEDVAFIARGEHLRAIAENGLRLSSDIGGTFIAWPRIATDDTRKVGAVDAVIVAVKGYSLADAVKTLLPLVGKETLVLPLLNGVGTGGKIYESLQQGLVLEGLTYASAYIAAPGEIVQKGAMSSIVLGAAPDRTAPAARVDALADALNRAGIDTVHDRDIMTAVWTKYLFITAFGSATSYYRCTAGELWLDPQRVETVRALCAEIASVAAASGVSLPADVAERSIQKAQGLAPDTKSSLQRDLEVPGKPNELEQLGGEVVRLGTRCGVPTPVNRLVYDALRTGKWANG